MTMSSTPTPSWFALAIALVFCVGVFHASSTSQRQHALDMKEIFRLFQGFVMQHGKSYPADLSTPESILRFNAFVNNYELVTQYNARSYEFGVDVTFELNQFADLSAEEFRAKYLMPRRIHPTFTASQYASLVDEEVVGDLPTSFDWRDKGAVTPVRDQGTVGTCWAFSTVENVESQWFLAGNNLTVLSVEQVVDCDGTQNSTNNDADCGVFGGWPYLSYQYVMKTGGLVTDASYPYCCGTGNCYPCKPPGYNETKCGPYASYCDPKQNHCTITPSETAAHIGGWFAVLHDEGQMAFQLVNQGPISILMDASLLQFYKSGIWDPSMCSKTETDHAILIVGYGTNGTDFWTVRNSWGESWGLNGYFYLARGKNACGVNTGPTTSYVTPPSSLATF